MARNFEGTKNNVVEKNTGSVRGFLDPSTYLSVKDSLRTNYSVQIF